MDMSRWLAFAAASTVMGLIPGPGVTAIVGYALGSGRNTALASVAGMTVGNMICMTLSLAGMGAVLAQSTAVFQTVKWAGALYLVALGCWTLWKARRLSDADHGQRRSVRPFAAFLGNVATGSFHPKTLVFFVAFAPQFIDVRHAYLPQAAILIATFCALVTVTAAYALLASRLAGLIRAHRAQLWSKRASGGVLIAAGVATAAAQK